MNNLPQITLQFSIKNVYGLDKLYPSNEKAGILCNLIKKQTIDTRDIHLIKSLGFNLEITQVNLPKWVHDAIHA